MITVFCSPHVACRYKGGLSFESHYFCALGVLVNQDYIYQNLKIIRELINLQCHFKVENEALLKIELHHTVPVLQVDKVIVLFSLLH